MRIPRVGAIIASVLLSGAAALAGTASASAHSVLPQASHNGVPTVVGTLKAVPATAAQMESLAGAVPDSYTQGCNSSQVNWVHLYDSELGWDLGSPTYCIGFVGTTELPYNASQILCSGNNNGTVWFYYNGVDYYAPFTQGGNNYWIYGQNVAVRVLHIDISKYSGSGSCRQ